MNLRNINPWLVVGMVLTVTLVVILVYRQDYVSATLVGVWSVLVVGKITRT